MGHRDDAQQSASLSERRMWEIARAVLREKTGIAASVYRNPIVEFDPAGRARYARNGMHLKVIAEMITEVLPAAADQVRIDYERIIVDVDSAVTTGASWTYTAPSDGYYFFHANHFIGADDAIWIEGDRISLKVIVAGSFVNYRYLDYHDTPADTTSIVFHQVLEGAQTIPLNTGEAVYIRFDNDTAVTRRMYQPARLTIMQLSEE